MEKIDGITLREIAERLSISEQNLQNKLTSADIKVSFCVNSQEYFTKVFIIFRRTRVLRRKSCKTHKQKHTYQ